MRSNKACTAAAPVSPREFIKAWQESNSVAEVAQKVRATKNACRVRAYRYRQWWGIPLKEFPPVEYEPTNWDELARYAAELIGEKWDEDDDQDKDNNDTEDGKDDGGSTPASSAIVPSDGDGPSSPTGP